MNTLEEYLQSIKEKEHGDELMHVIMWVQETFPQLDLKIAWNQPMFTDHGTYIIGLSASTMHFSIAPEQKILEVFLEQIATKYTYGKHMFRIEWNQTIDFVLLQEIIQYYIEEKKNCKTFWLK